MQISISANFFMEFRPYLNGLVRKGKKRKWLLEVKKGYFVNCEIANCEKILLSNLPDNF